MPLPAVLARPVALMVLAGVALLLTGTAFAGGQVQAGGAGGGRGGQPQRDTSAMAATPAGTSIITGTVVSAATGVAARRARVSVAGEAIRGGRSATTDDQGRYAFTGLPAGRYTLTASKSGYLVVTYGQRVPGSGRSGTPIQLGDGQKLTVQLQLPKGGVLSGIVIDEEGEPAPITNVLVLRESLTNGTRTLQSAGAETTDDRGMYRVFGLQPGTYFVVATPRNDGGNFASVVQMIGSDAGAATSSGTISIAGSARSIVQSIQSSQASDAETGRTGYAPVYYPGTTDAGNATAIPLGVGEERLGLDMQLQLAAMARIEGVVTSASGQARGVQLQLSNVNGTAGFGGMGTGADQSGRFSFASVPPGQYVLTALSGERDGAPEVLMLPGRGGGPVRATGRPNGPANQQVFWASLDISVDGTNQTVGLTLQPALSVTGRLEFRGDSTRVPRDLTSVRVQFSPADPAGRGRGLTMAATGRTDSEGRFTVEGIVPGRYNVSVGMSGWFLSSADIAGQDAVDGPIDIRAGQGVGGAVLTFTDRASTLVGAVTDAQGQPTSDYALVVYANRPAVLGPDVAADQVRQAGDRRHLHHPGASIRRLQHRAGSRSGTGKLVRPRIPAAPRSQGRALPRGGRRTQGAERQNRRAH